jgi:acyl-CoA hydrolase
VKSTKEVIGLERETKTSGASYTIQTQIVRYADANGTGKLFGGQLMSWMDIVGAVAARRHSGREVVTAQVDSMSFLTPAVADDTIVLEARVVKVGNSSMHVKIDAHVERLREPPRLVCTSTFIYVALDEFARPTRVPGLEDEGGEGGGGGDGEEGLRRPAL